MHLRALILMLASGLVGCTIAPAGDPVPDPLGPKTSAPPIVTAPDQGLRAQGREGVRNFVAVVDQIEPVAEAICRERTVGRNCDFQIVVDDTINAPPNAFQTVDAAGNPIIAFTIPLIIAAQNQDELAFILAHEAAHHILDHLRQQRRNAQIGATILGRLIGGGAQTQRTAQQLGAAIGARTYSKDFELEADALGTRITIAGGYDPLRGAAFFERIPDPGNQFLGTHPANADRLATVQQVAAAAR